MKRRAMEVWAWHLLATTYEHTACDGLLVVGSWPVVGARCRRITALARALHASGAQTGESRMLARVGRRPSRLQIDRSCLTKAALGTSLQNPYNSSIWSVVLNPTGRTECLPVQFRRRFVDQARAA
jgi:hypothetical protein